MGQKLVRFDWAVKKLLRSKANFGILEGFLTELLAADVKIIDVLESEGNQETANDKFNRVDLLAKNSRDEIVIIEVQVDTEYDYLSRIMYGASKAITEHMKAGSPYSEVKKVYSVSIVYFDLGKGDDYVYSGQTVFRGIHTKNKLELNERQKFVYKKERVEQIFPEYYVIKVNQFNDYAKDSLDEWIYFFKNEEIKSEFRARGLKEASEKLQVMRLPLEEQGKYKRYLEELHYQASMAQSKSLDISILDGIREGREQGIKEGERLAAVNIARNLRKSGISGEAIQNATGLSKEEIEKL